MNVFLAVAVSLVVREGTVAFRDGRCDNDDATSDSITCSCILIYVLALSVQFYCVVLVICSNLARDMLIKVDKRTTFSTETNLQPDQQRKVPDLLTPPYPEILFK